ncbi:hypothetical protein GQ457_06G039000 [Hibiscus cannabinus]
MLYNRKNKLSWVPRDGNRVTDMFVKLTDPSALELVELCSPPEFQTINDYPFVVGQSGTRFSSDLDYFFDNCFWAILFWSFGRRELFLIE